MPFSHDPSSSQRVLSPASGARHAPCWRPAARCFGLHPPRRRRWCDRPSSRRSTPPRYSPSSPDPAGIAYMPAQDRLLISDSEVNETPLFQGFNLFTATRTGSGVRQRQRSCPTSRSPPTSGSTRPTAGSSSRTTTRTGSRRLSRGPTASTAPPTTPGPNFSTSAFGSTDPEGVEYDPATGRLFVCDGARPRDLRRRSGQRRVRRRKRHRHPLRPRPVRSPRLRGPGDRPGPRQAPRRGSRRPTTIYELGMDGALLRTLDMAAIPTSHSVVADVTMAPCPTPTTGRRP